MGDRLSIDPEKIAAFCQRWKIAELSLFGSVLRNDFGPDSDIDILVSFVPDIPWSLYDWMEMQEELKVLFGRDVDLVEKSTLRNPFRRHAILPSRMVIYGASQ